MLEKKNQSCSAIEFSSNQHLFGGGHVNAILVYA